MPDPSDQSDLVPNVFNEYAPINLPTRSEKQILYAATPGTPAELAGYRTTAAFEGFTEFVQVRIPGRGADANGNPDITSSAFFEFVVNPSQIQIARQTVDAQSLTRDGWQIGVWGEDFLSISLHGKTPGKYFYRGLTDLDASLTLSYRNLAALEVFFENNGYFFEGEQAARGQKFAEYTRARIKCHQSVFLTASEFVWEGMFESLSIAEDSANPYLADFNIGFLAWRERFRAETPYPNSIDTAVDRGHDAQVVLATQTLHGDSEILSQLADQSTQQLVASVLSGVSSPLVTQPVGAQAVRNAVQGLTASAAQAFGSVAGATPALPPNVSASSGAFSGTFSGSQPTVPPDIGRYDTTPLQAVFSPKSFAWGQ